MSEPFWRWAGVRWIGAALLVAGAAIVGQALLLGARELVDYTVVVALAFHLFVVAYEEPTLRAQFGAEYEEYCRRARRWRPRLPAG